jgi:hypothetical protein
MLLGRTRPALQTLVFRQSSAFQRRKILLGTAFDLYPNGREIRFPASLPVPLTKPNLKRCRQFQQLT